MSDQIYVVGHINPDTDTVAAAMGYAWLLRERDGVNTVAARAGALNAQTAWVLKTLGLEPPVLLTDASPRFESVMHRLDTIRPDSQLGLAWTLASRTGGIAPVVSEDGKPFGLINGLSLFKYFTEVLGPRPGNATVREMMSVSCADAADTTVPKYAANAHIRDMLNRILRDEHNEYWVVDENGQYLGIARQRDVLNPPRLKIILVDHNEPRQAIAALEEAELLEILDHHRLGNPHTHTPIRFTVDIVGSTSTLVSEQTAEAGLSMPPALAGTLLAGLLADTLIFTSPTTTPRDKAAAERLSRWAFVGNGPLKGETIESYGKAVLSAGAGLSNRDPKDVVSTDIKPFEAGDSSSRWPRPKSPTCCRSPSISIRCASPLMNSRTNAASTLPCCSSPTWCAAPAACWSRPTPHPSSTICPILPCPTARVTRRVWSRARSSCCPPCWACSKSRPCLQKNPSSSMMNGGQTPVRS
jgi:manganese-dependent inorganic pyrophosphatase